MRHYLEKGVSHVMAHFDVKNEAVDKAMEQILSMSSKSGDADILW